MYSRRIDSPSSSGAILLLEDRFGDRYQFIISEIRLTQTTRIFDFILAPQNKDKQIEIEC